MINPIRLLVGELLELLNGERYLIISSLTKNQSGYVFMNLKDFTTITGWERLINLAGGEEYIKKVGIVNKDSPLVGEDWICHEERCYPKILAGSCKGCMYHATATTKKRYYEPGDIVWIPSEKREAEIYRTDLFYSLHPNGPYSLASNLRYQYLSSLDKISEFIVKFGIKDKTQESNNEPLGIKFLRYKYYRWDRLRCINRKSWILNVSQLKEICNNMCLFGPYNKSEECKKCKTGEFWRFIKNDIRRNS